MVRQSRRNASRNFSRWRSISFISLQTHCAVPSVASAADRRGCFIDRTFQYCLPLPGRNARTFRPSLSYPALKIQNSRQLPLNGQQNRRPRNEFAETARLGLECAIQPLTGSGPTFHSVACPRCSNVRGDDGSDCAWLSYSSHALANRAGQRADLGVTCLG